MSRTSGRLTQTYGVSSQAKYGTAFSWRHKGPTTSKLTDLIKRPIHLLHLVMIHVHVDTRDTFPIMFDISVYWCHWSLVGTHALFYTGNKRRGVIPTACTISLHFLIWMTRVGNVGVVRGVWNTSPESRIALSPMSRRYTSTINKVLWILCLNHR